MRWGALGLGIVALMLAAGAFALAFATRADSPRIPVIATNIAPAVATTPAPAAVETVTAVTVTATTPAPATTAPAPAAPAPASKKAPRHVTKPSCRANGDNGDPTGSDTPSCSSGDGGGGGDNQAGDGKSGGA